MGGWYRFRTESGAVIFTAPGFPSSHRLYPWRHHFHADTHNSHPHTSPPSLLPSPFNFPLTGVHVGSHKGLEEGGGKRGRREGTRGRRKKKKAHNSEVAYSNFLQISNRPSVPPRTAPGNLKGVANSLGNHYHGNQTTRIVRDRAELSSNNVRHARSMDSCSGAYSELCAYRMLVLLSLI